MNASLKEFADGFLSLTGGMHGGIDPLVLNADSGMYHIGVNVTARDGVLQTRPAFVLSTALASGKFQGAGVWKLNGCDRLVYVVDGILYSLRLDTKVAVSHGLLFDPDVDRVSFCQAFKWMVVQDGTSQPQALEEGDDGVAVLYSRSVDYTSEQSPPAALCLAPATVMAYAHGRIHHVPTHLPALDPVITDEADADQLNVPATPLTASGRSSFVSGDILDIYVPEFVFRMTEHRNLTEGGALELPQELGFIHGMAAIRNAATGTGTGPLIVLGRDGVCAFDVSIPRSEWKKNQIGQVLFSTVGTDSPYSVVQMNTDVGFLDTEGRLRTIKFEGSSVANSLVSLPISHELQPLHDLDTAPQLASASASFTDSRLTFTMLGATGPVYKALASLDFAKVYSMSGATGASFDGIWTGFDFQQTLSARDADRKWQQYVVIKRTTGENLLYVLSETAIKDNDLTSIKSTVITRYMDFGAAIDAKALQYVELWLSDIATSSSVSVYFRPRGNSDWIEVSTKTFNVPAGSLPQHRRRVTFPLSLDSVECDPVTGDHLSVATHMQFALVWQGRLKIDRFRAVAALRTEPASSCLDEDNPQDVSLAEGDTGVQFDFVSGYDAFSGS